MKYIENIQTNYYKKIHLIIYGNNVFNNSKERIYKEAINSKFFNSVSIYSPDDLSKEFVNNFSEILSLPRIGGYGIWRPYIIKEKLNKIDENDYLIYLDAGCTINHSAEKRFYEYIELLNNSEYGIISFQLTHPERNYTTNEIFEYFNLNVNSKEALDNQFLDGILIMKKNNHLINIIDKWLEVVYNNPLLFTDYFNNDQNDYFIDNRHEQSILSIIVKLYGSIILNDETYFEKYDKDSDAINYPFWATRLK